MNAESFGESKLVPHTTRSSANEKCRTGAHLRTVRHFPPEVFRAVCDTRQGALSTQPQAAIRTAGAALGEGGAAGGAGPGFCVEVDGRVGGGAGFVVEALFPVFIDGELRALGIGARDREQEGRRSARASGGGRDDG